MHNHHMVSNFADWWGDLDRDDPYYQVKLTVAGHACQHDILYRVFRDQRDMMAAQMLYGQAGMTEKAKAHQKTGQQAGGWFGGRAAVASGQLAEAREKALKKTRKQVILTSPEGVETLYPSLRAAGRAININAASICYYCKGTAGPGLNMNGYTARYA